MNEYQQAMNQFILFYSFMHEKHSFEMTIFKFQGYVIYYEKATKEEKWKHIFWKKPDWLTYTKWPQYHDNLQIKLRNIFANCSTFLKHFLSLNVFQIISHLFYVSSIFTNLVTKCTYLFSFQNISLKNKMQARWIEVYYRQSILMI